MREFDMEELSLDGKMEAMTLGGAGVDGRVWVSFYPYSVRASSFRPCNMSSRLITPVHPPFFLSAPILMYSICFFFFFSGEWIDYVGSGPPEVYYRFIRRALEDYLGSSRSHRCRETRVRRRLKVISSVTSRGTYLVCKKFGSGA